MQATIQELKITQDLIQAVIQVTILEHTQEPQHTQELTPEHIQAVTQQTIQVMQAQHSQGFTQALIQGFTQELKTTPVHTQELIQVVTQEHTQEPQHTQEHIPVLTQDIMPVIEFQQQKKMWQHTSYGYEQLSINNFYIMEILWQSLKR